MKCRLCRSSKQKKYYYADILFNGEVFSHYKCMSCGSVSVLPDPDATTFEMMYGENDHSYLRATERIEHCYNYSRLNQRSIQLSFLKKSGLPLKNKILLDYASGSGFYMKFAENMGASVIGIEFDTEFAQLISEKSGMRVMSFPSFKKLYQNKTIDYIHFGHILEHLSDPGTILSEIEPFATPETVYIFDGPLDKNICVSRLIIDFGTRLLRRKIKQYPPQHLSLTTAKSQRNFLEINGFHIRTFKIREQRKPVLNGQSSVKHKVLNIFSLFSVFVSSLIPGWGNVFHCIAVKEQK